MCLNCFKWLSCCGLGCGMIASIGEICKGIRTVKEDVVESIENKFRHPRKYFLHKEGDLYEDLRDGEIVHLSFFANKPIEKSLSV